VQRMREAPQVFFLPFGKCHRRIIGEPRA
jgi:hypothetical protein